MKFKIKRSILLNALANVSRAVSQKTPLPTLTGIKFELTDEALILTGSDSDITIQTTITDQLEIIEPGAIVLSAKYIVEIIKRLDSDDVSIFILDGTLTRIQGGSSKFDLNGTDAFDYPRIDLSQNGVHLTIGSQLLKGLIEKTVFATSDKENRPTLTGVNFKAKETTLTAVATDSYRLAQCTTSLEENQSFNIVVPKKSLSEISRMIEKDENMDVFVSDHKILFVVGNFLILSRLIDGAYPDVSKLLMNNFNSSLSINANDLLKAIDRAALLSDDAKYIITLSMSPDRVRISSNSQEIGSVDEELPEAFYKGAPLDISFSAKYLNEAIRSINTETVKIQFTENMRPFMITDVDHDDNIQVILPVRTY